MRLIRRYSFEAAHQLNGLPDDHPCSRLHGHGYRFEVIVEANETDERGMIIEYAELDAIVAPVLERYDHRFINDFIDQPTVENMVVDIYDLLSPASRKRWFISKVRLWETERSSVEFP